MRHPGSYEIPELQNFGISGMFGDGISGMFGNAGRHLARHGAIRQDLKYTPRSVKIRTSGKFRNSIISEFPEIRKAPRTYGKTLQDFRTSGGTTRSVKIRTSGEFRNFGISEFPGGSKTGKLLTRSGAIWQCLEDTTRSAESQTSAKSRNTGVPKFRNF